jgi:hypothetical protein
MLPSVFLAVRIDSARNAKGSVLYWLGYFPSALYILRDKPKETDYV